MEIKGGTITAENVGGSYGIYANDKIVVTGGTIKASGNVAGSPAYSAANASMEKNPVDLSNNPLFQLIIPGMPGVRSVIVDLPPLTDFHISVNHPNDNALYLWVPQNVTAASVMVKSISSVTKTGDDFPIAELAAVVVLARQGERCYWQGVGKRRASNRADGLRFFAYIEKGSSRKRGDVGITPYKGSGAIFLRML